MYSIENRNEKLLGAEAFSGLKCQGFILNLKGSLHVPKLIFQYINLVKDFSLLCKPCLTVFICRSSYLQQISAAYLSDIVTLCAAVYTACSEFSLPLLKIYSISHFLKFSSTGPVLHMLSVPNTGCLFKSTSWEHYSTLLRTISPFLPDRALCRTASSAHGFRQLHHSPPAAPSPQDHFARHKVRTSEI